MTKKVSTIILGAGTAALAAANRLLDLGISDFLILEKGNNINKRTCPGVKTFDCKFCRAGCYTIEGIGGSNALHGNKICYFPASSEILSNCDENEKQTILNYLNNYRPYVDNNNLPFTSAYQDSFKFYYSDVLNKNEYKFFINSLTVRLFEKQLIASNVDIIKIEKRRDGFVLKDEKGQEYFCSNLVMATGRSSYTFLKNIFDSLQIRYSSLNQDIGIRIETNKENFNETYYYQVDPKIKFEYESLGLARTFCAHNQGLVVPVQFGNTFFADGAFSDNFSNHNNIALMVRSNEGLTNFELEDWCKKMNAYCNNSLVLKKINLSEKSKTELTNEIFSSIPFFPSEKHKELMRKLVSNLFDSNQYGILNNTLNFELTIYAPAIDRYWVAPALDRNLQTIGVKNCYVIGDAIGKSRGILQAMFSGVLWANAFSKTLIKEKPNDKVWSGWLSTSI